MKPSRPPRFRFAARTALVLACLTLPGRAATPAFPGAEGYGRYASGGRGGAVYEVTNLNDAGPGSLRAAVEANGPRTVVFRVSGTIFLNSNLSINRDHLTIAGQTAPGDGICLANYSMTVNADNVIIRFLRVRVGDQGSEDGADGRDAIFVRYTDRVIVDHCSFSWSIDETASAYFNTRFTMQWCLAAESLRESLHSKGAHGYGGIWGGQGATFHHNLLAHHSSRNPRFAGSRSMPATHNGILFNREQVDHRNNVIYNWSGNSCYGGEPREDGVPSLYNMIGNYYKAGPATSGSKHDRILQPSVVNGVYSHYCITGNVTTASAATTADNWRGVDDPTEAEKDIMRLDDPVAADPITEHDAYDAYQAVLQFVGACFPTRDSVDTRVLAEVVLGTAPHGANGIIDSQSEVGGWPTLNSVPAPADADHDGMPDAWETAHPLLNPNNAADRNGDPDGDGYTHLEDYLNSLVNHLYPAPAFHVEQTPPGISVTWSNQLNHCRLEASSDLEDWDSVDGTTGSAGAVSTSDTPSFFRLVSDD